MAVYSLPPHNPKIPSISSVTSFLNFLSPSITFPITGRIHFRGRVLFNDSTLLRRTILIGNTPIRVYAEDDSAIAKVEFYLNDELVFNDTEAPYQWTTDQRFLRKPMFIPRRYTITVKAIDDTGKTSTDSKEVLAFRVFGI